RSGPHGAGRAICGHRGDIDLDQLRLDTATRCARARGRAHHRFSQSHPAAHPARRRHWRALRLCDVLRRSRGGAVPVERRAADIAEADVQWNSRDDQPDDYGRGNGSSHAFSLPAHRRRAPAAALREIARPDAELNIIERAAVFRRPADLHLHPLLETRALRIVGDLDDEMGLARHGKAGADMIAEIDELLDRAVDDIAGAVGRRIDLDALRAQGQQWTVALIREVYG